MMTPSLKTFVFQVTLGCLLLCLLPATSRALLSHAFQDSDPLPHVEVAAVSGSHVFAHVFSGQDIRSISESSMASDQSVGATLEGYVTDAVTGLPLSGVLVSVAGLSATTDDSGFYRIGNVPPAILHANFYANVTEGNAPLTVQFTDTSRDDAHELTATRSGFSDYTNSQVTVEPDDTTTFSFSMNPVMHSGEMRFVLNWGANPRDLDLHLQTPEIDGTTYHINFSDRGDASSPPYATLDQDITTGHGPETITIHRFFNGTYQIFVHLFAGEGTLAISDATVQVYTDQGLLQAVNVPQSGDGRYWNVAEVDGASRRVRIINRIQEVLPDPAQSSPLPRKSPVQARTSGITRSWNFGDNTTSTDRHPSHTYRQPGRYTVTLEVTNDQGLQDTRVRTDYIVVASTQGTVKWSSPLSADENPFIRSSPALSADGRTVYVGANDDKVYALRVDDGATEWSFATNGPVRSSPSVGADGTIYVGSNDGNLYALDPDGNKKWQVTTGAAIWSSPAVGADGAVYVSGTDGKLYARTRDGIEKWTLELGEGFLSAPVIGTDGRILLGSEEGLFYSVNPGDGTEYWEYDAGWIVYGSAAVGSDGTVYATTNDGVVFALDRATGQPRWTRALETSLYSSPAIDSDALYFGGRDGKLYALSLTDGSDLWSVETGGLILSSPVIGDDQVIYFGGYDHYIHAVRTTGETLWSYKTGDVVFSSPVLGTDGTVYIGGHDGRMYAIASGAHGPAGTAWPGFRRNSQNTGRADKRISIVPFLLPLLLGE